MKTGLGMFFDEKSQYFSFLIGILLGAHRSFKREISATVSEGFMMFQNVLADFCITGFVIKIYQVLDR